MTDGSGGSRPIALSIVLPAHNEEQTLGTTVGEVVRGLRERGATFEVLVVENGSDDATAKLASQLATDHVEVRASSSAQADYGAALRQGLLDSRGEIVVNFDVDYFDLGFLDNAVEIIRRGEAAMVIGTKRGAGARDERPVSRRVVTAGFALVLRLGFGLRASDTHGMKAFGREQLVPLAERCQLGTDLFDTELILRAERAGLTVTELPVHVEELRPARSSILRRMARTPFGLLRLRAALRQ